MKALWYIHFFYFCSKHRLCVLARTVTFFIRKLPFLQPLYHRVLHRRVIVMLYFQVASSGNLYFDGDEYYENMFPTKDDFFKNIIAVFWDLLKCAKVLYRETTIDSFLMVS